MARSEILKRVASKEMDVEMGLKILLLVANDIGNEDLISWAYYELNGYKEEVDVPNYRIIKSGKIIYSGVNGKNIVDKMPLPVSSIPFVIMSALNKNYVRNGINNLIKFSEATNSSIEKDLTMLSYEIFKYSGIRCELITMQFDSKTFLNILASIRNKLLENLMIVDREYGNLDNLYVDMFDREQDIEGMNEYFQTKY